MNEDHRTKRVFLSYSLRDKDKAMLLANKLKNTGLEIITEYENISFGENIFDELKYLLQSNDFVIILLSKALFESSYFKYEFTKNFFQETKKRKISIIPVLIEKCNIPTDFLEYEIINLSSGFDKGLDKLLQRIKTIPEVSFERITPLEFEEIIFDLLQSYGFKNIIREDRINRGVDFIAEYFSKNPFGQKRKELWMIESKFYSESRFDIRAIKKIVEQYKYINKNDAKLLLVTNSQINSVLEEYLNDVRRVYCLDIEVIDGLLLKKLIANKKRILNKYFLK
ncbi:TIR domain-containing protein [Flavobacterium ginsenosidimutans]|uniref:TIR domain-containing protein n=1 Tax=Flavobacterium ginsenosidimutans TaxID=687844 RepID=UPI003D96FE9E